MTAKSKKCSVLYVLMIALNCVYAPGQTTQKGVTLEYRGKDKKTALPNVQIIANGSSTVSTGSGDFSLYFQTLKKGDRVIVNRIAKSGYVVFNKDALDQWIVSSSENIFKIVLCKAEDFDNLVNTYYGVSMKEYENRLNQERELLRQLKEEGKIKEQEYSMKLLQAEENYQKCLNQLQDLAETMARIDESEVDSTTQRALELTSMGRIEEAADIIRKRDLSGKLKRIVEKEKLGRQLYEEATDDKRKTIDAIKTEILILQSHGGKDNFSRCADLYRGIVQADTLDYDNSLKCATFLYRQNLFKEANRYFVLAKDVYGQTHDLSKADFLLEYTRINSNLANSLCDSRQFREAEQLYLDSIVELESKCDTARYDCISLLAVMNNSLGSMLCDSRDYDSAKPYLERALELEDRIRETDDAIRIRNRIAVLNNLFIACSQRKEFSEAHDCLDRAIDLINMSEEIPQREKKERLGAAYNNKALTLYRQEQNDEAEKFFKKSIRIREDLTKENPVSHLPSLLRVKVNYCALLQDTGDYVQADSIYNETLRVLDTVIDRNPAVYTPILASVLNNRADLYMAISEYEKAETTMLRAIEVKRKMMELSERFYTNTYLSSVLLLSKVYACQTRFGESHGKCNEIMEFLGSADYMQKDSKESISGQVQATDIVYYLMEGKTDVAADVYRKVSETVKNPAAFRKAILKNISFFGEKGVIPAENVETVEQFKASLK